MSGRRLKILLAKPVLPYPPDQGTKVVSFAIVEALAQAHDVTVLARILDPGEAVLARELETRGVRVVTVLPANRRHVVARVAFKVFYVARSLVFARSLKSQYDCPGAFVSAARALSRGGAFDLVILEYWQLHPLLDVFPRERTVLLTHDIDQFVNRDRARLEKNVFARAAALWRWWLERTEETSAYRHSLRVVALTTRDADAVRRISSGEARVAVLPFGLPATSFAATATARTSREVLFLGAMGAAFNRDALGHFALDIHPLLANIDSIRFTIVGGALPHDIKFLGAFANVEVVGHARDARPFLDRATCLVVPLRYGGGLRIRIIEAMAAGLPVVAAPVAVEGMDLEPGRHVLIATSPDEYRTHVARLLEDRDYAAALAARARSHAWETYGPAARGERLRAFVEGLAG